jgi:zinc protease
VSRTALVALLALAACGPKTPPPAAPVAPSDPLADAPPIPRPGPWSPPTAATATLASGAELWHIEQRDLPLVELRLWLPGGSIIDPADHHGLTYLADQLVLFGAGDRDAEAFAATTEQLAIEMAVSTWEAGTVVSVSCHADRLDTALDLLADVVLRPRFDASEVERERDLQIAAVERALDDPRTVASWTSTRLWYGADHPSAHPADGDAAGLAGLDAKATKASWTARAKPQGARLVAVGAVEKDDLVARIDARFAGWTGAGPAARKFPRPAGVEGGPRLVFVDAPGSSQSVLRVLLPGWTASDPALPAAELGGIVLGGTFTSRLNRLLREEKGYTYGARARVYGSRHDGMVVASTNVRGDVTGPALADLLGELERARAGVDAAERDKAFGAARTSAIETTGTRGGLAEALVGATSDGRGPDAIPAGLAAAEAADEAAVDAALATFDLSKALVVVVGDLAAVRDQVEEAVPGSWEVVEAAPR